MLLQLTNDIFIQKSDLYSTLTAVIRKGTSFFISDPGISEGDFDEILSITGSSEIITFTTHCHWDHLLSHEGMNIIKRYSSHESVKMMADNHSEIIKEIENNKKFIGENNDFWKKFLFKEEPLDFGRMYTFMGFKFILIPVPGHMKGQSAVYFPEDKILLASDILSPTEIPTFEKRKDLPQYINDLILISGYIGESDYIIPGHGYPMEKEEASEIIKKDLAYLKDMNRYCEKLINKDTESFIEGSFNLPSLRSETRLTGYAAYFHKDNIKSVIKNHSKIRI